LESTSCNFIIITFGTDDPTSGHHAYIKLVVQSGTDTVFKMIPAGKIGTISATLDGGPLIFGVSDDTISDYSVYFNGFASCYTEDGRPLS
jgi:hypothetical protein